MRDAFEEARSGRPDQSAAPPPRLPPLVISIAPYLVFDRSDRSLAARAAIFFASAAAL